MKKIIKPIIVIVIIIGLAVGGLYGGYRYNQSKKVAEVISLNGNYSMQGYWGDSIESYGEVTADKAQTTYLASGTEVLSVNFAAGDHVNEGDVLLTVKKESQNITGKELEVQKAQQTFVAAANKLERLENTTPISEYVATSEDTKTVTFVSQKTYSVKEDCTLAGNDYSAGEVVYEIFYSSNGEETIRSYYAPGSMYPIEDNDANKEQINNLKSAIEAAGADAFTEDQNEITEEVVVGKYYYDGETGAVLGRDDYVHGVNARLPQGYKPSELKAAIEQATDELAHADLDFRIKSYQLEVMRNTDDNGEIKAKVSGTVSKVQNKDNYNSTQPFMIVTGTDDYYITGSIGEFYLGSVNVGDTVTVMSWDTGTSAEAVITSISDSPTTDSNNFYGGSGNSNSSNYEFKATFDKSAGIEIGAAVDITITPEGQENNSLYVQNEFVRKDSTGSYVMRMNENNQLEKVYVKVGKSLWGYMIEVKEGITADDYVAFPYGNGAVEGMKCKVVDSLEY